MVRRRWILAVVVAGMAHAGAALLVRLAGFDSISDDDHARVVLAQRWAAQPGLDPTGTSWLPVPFWLVGLGLRALGPSLRVAHALAVVAAGLSGALLVVAARWLDLRPRQALGAALLSLTIPLVPLLGAAPVPELPVAAVTAAALLHLHRARDASRRRWALVAALLLLATLSRYDPWALALGLGLGTLARLAAGWRPAAGRAWVAACALVSAAGPALWLLWNLHRYGDALRFAHRVASYRAALGAVAQGLGSYPAAVLREAALAAAVSAWAAWRWPGLRAPVGAAWGLVAALTAAELRGGAPTHHPERAVLGGMLALLLVAWAGVERAREENRERGSEETDRSRGARGTLPLLGLVAMSAAVGAWRWGPTWRGLGASRAAEVALGRSLQGALPPGERALLVADSYGFLAIEAALARPGALVVAVPRRVDPRSALVGEPMADEASLQALGEQHPEAGWWLLRAGQAPWWSVRPEDVPLEGGWLRRRP